jgi:uncharacterized protein (UPF0332 family)
MIFTWEDYLTFAEKLLSIVDGNIICNELDSHETLLRTAISRAYYGSYHAALSYLLDNTNFQRQSYDPHMQVINAYRNSVYRDRKAIAPILLLLRNLRTKADYEIVFDNSTQSTYSSVYAATSRSIREAKKVIEMVNNFTPRNNRNI